MIVIYVTVIVLVCFLVLLQRQIIWFPKKPFGQGKLPQREKATMFDVRHLLMEGKKDEAIYVYCSIFNVGLRQAKNDVEELERSLRV